MAREETRRAVWDFTWAWKAVGEVKVVLQVLFGRRAKVSGVGGVGERGWGVGIRGTDPVVSSCHLQIRLSGGTEFGLWDEAFGCVCGC